MSNARVVTFTRTKETVIDTHEIVALDFREKDGGLSTLDVVLRGGAVVRVDSDEVPPIKAFFEDLAERLIEKNKIRVSGSGTRDSFR